MQSCTKQQIPTIASEDCSDRDRIRTKFPSRIFTTYLVSIFAIVDRFVDRLRYFLGFRLLQS